MPSLATSNPGLAYFSIFPIFPCFPVLISSPLSPCLPHIHSFTSCFVSLCTWWRERDPPTSNEGAPSPWLLSQEKGECGLHWELSLEMVRGTSRQLPAPLSSLSSVFSVGSQMLDRFGFLKAIRITILYMHYYAVRRWLRIPLNRCQANIVSVIFDLISQVYSPIRSHKTFCSCSGTQVQTAKGDSL